MLSATARSVSGSSMTRSVVNQPKRKRAQHGLGLRHALRSAALTRRHAGPVPKGRGRGTVAMGIPRRRKRRRESDAPSAV